MQLSHVFLGLMAVTVKAASEQAGDPASFSFLLSIPFLSSAILPLLCSSTIWVTHCGEVISVYGLCYVCLQINSFFI